jgi:Putative addiction module component
MKSTAQLEKEVLSLPPEERAHLALAAWESLEADPVFAADPMLDPEGVALALERDAEIESGSAKPLSHAEFRQRTAGAKR